METKLYKKRLEIMSQLGEIKESKKGSKYVIIKEYSIIPKQYKISHRTVTIGKLKNIGDTVSYSKNNRQILLLTSNNKLMIKYTGRFKNLGYSTLLDYFYSGINYEIDEKTKKKIIEISLYNKKAYWLKDHPDLLEYHRLAMSFDSKEAFLKHLGFEKKEKPNVYEVGCYIAGYNFKHKQILKNANVYDILDIIEFIKKTGKTDVYDTKKSINELIKVIKTIYGKNKYEDFIP